VCAPYSFVSLYNENVPQSIHNEKETTSLIVKLPVRNPEIGPRRIKRHARAHTILPRCDYRCSHFYPLSCISLCTNLLSFVFQVREMIQNLNHTDAKASAEMTFQVSFSLLDRYFIHKKGGNIRRNIFKDLIAVNRASGRVV
jgi:hypothetical protein